MKQLKTILIITLCIFLLTGCTKQAETKVENIDNEVKEEYLFENNAKNIEQGGKIARYKDTYYYSEVKDGGKLYSKSISGKGEPKKVNDDVPGSINIYDDKLYYINYAQKDTSPVVVLDIKDTSKREVQDRDVMTMLIKDNKMITAYRGEDGTGHTEGYSYIDVEVSDLKTGEVIDTYSPGYGSITLIDESKYISFSTMVGNLVMDNNGDKVLYPLEDKRDFMISYVGENEKGILINATETGNVEIPGIYWLYNDGGYTSVATPDSTIDIQPDEYVVNGVSTDEDLFYFTEESMNVLNYKSDKSIRIMDYNLEITDGLYKFENTLIILKENGDWEEFDLNKLKEEANSNQVEEKDEEENKEDVVDSSSKLKDMSDEKIISTLKDYVGNIYNKYYTERDSSDSIEGGYYSAINSTYKTKEKLIDSMSSYFTDEMLDELRNTDDMKSVDGKEYLQSVENPYINLCDVTEIKSKSYKNGVLTVEYISDWAGTDFDCMVEFIEVNGIIKINKIDYYM